MKISFFQNFVSFYFILFFKKKNFVSEIYYLQLIGQRLLFIDYCWSQYNIAIQFSTPSPFLATIHQVYCNTNKEKQPFKPTIIQFLHSTAHPCNTIRVLQYNGSTTNLLIAIQFQPTAPPYCNTIFQPHAFSCNAILLLQYKPSQLHPSLVIQFQYFVFSSPLSCNTIARFQCNFFFHNTIGQ